MKRLEISQRKQFVSLLVHHMMYSDDKYAHILTILDRWESESPAQGFDFGIDEIKNKENPKGRRIKKM
jgi:hypothetical protein